MAIIQPVENNWNLYEGNGRTFYQVSPANGARIEGIFSVQMSSHVRGNQHLPAIVVDICPQLANDGKATGEYYPLVVNGKTVEIFYRSYVELMPTFPDVEEDVITLGDATYGILPRVGGYEKLTEKACELVRDALKAIAKDYITPERWQAQRVSEARAKVETTSQNHDKARQAWVDAINELDRVRKGY